MNVNQIKTAVQKGQTVHWKNENYKVVFNHVSGFMIKSNSNEHFISLTWKDGETLNGKENEFFIGHTEYKHQREPLFYWEVLDFTGQTFNLMDEGAKINGHKISKTDVEDFVGRKLKVCGAHENPHIIVEPRIKENGQVFQDLRTRLRGRNKYYVLAE